LKVETLFAAYLPLYAKEDEGIKRVSKSIFTAKIHEADKARDEICTGMMELNEVTPSVTFTSGSATTPEAEFTMPAEAVTATAVYEPIPPTYHLITVHKEGSGIANPNVESATQGTQITLTATFTMPDNAVEVKAVFEEIPSPILLPQLASGNRAVQMRNGLSLTASSNATVEIYGLNGNLVSRQNFASGVYAISFGHLPKGVYLAKVSFGSGKEVLRVPVR